MEKEVNLYALVTEALSQEKLDEVVGYVFQISISNKEQEVTPKLKSSKKNCLEQLYILIKVYLDSNEVEKAEKLIAAYLYLQEDERINILKNIYLQKKEQINTVCIEQAKKTVQENSSLKKDENKYLQTKNAYILKYIILLIAVALILGGVIWSFYNYATKNQQNEFPIGDIKKKDILSNNVKLENLLSSLIHQWNDAHTQCDLSTLRSLYDYSDKIKFYGQYLTKEQCINNCYNIYKKLDGDFNQNIVSAITYSTTEDGEYRCDFVKSVTTKGKRQNYSSYLVFRAKNGGWYIIEESDEITDRKLQKKSGKSWKKMNLVGKIGGKYKVTLHLVNNKGEIHGSYYYNKYGKDHTIKLQGVITENQMQLKEYNEKGENTGFFDGKLDSHHFYGTFTNYKGAKMNFDLSLL